MLHQVNEIRKLSVLVIGNSFQAIVILLIFPNDFAVVMNLYVAERLLLGLQEV